MKIFLDNKNDKVTDRALTQGLVVAILSIALCIVVLCSMTYAWFNADVSSTGNVLESSRFALDIKVLDGNGEELQVVETENAGVYTCTLTAIGQYTVYMTMTPDSTASKGYCNVIPGERDKMQTAPISKDADIGTETITFTVDSDNADTVIAFEPKWGLPANATIMPEDVVATIDEQTIN